MTNRLPLFLVLATALLLPAASHAQDKKKPSQDVWNELSGGRAREIQVVVDVEKLNSYGLTVDQVRDAIQKSFPGCKWTSDADARSDTILIEIHRLASHYSEGGWDAAAVV